MPPVDMMSPSTPRRKIKIEDGCAYFIGVTAHEFN